MGEPVPVARYELTETFPGLLQPIHDSFVPDVGEGLENIDFSKLSPPVNEDSKEEPLHPQGFAAQEHFNNRPSAGSFVFFLAILPACFVFLVMHPLQRRFEQNGSSAQTTKTVDGMQDPLLPKKKAPPYRPGYLFAFVLLATLFLYVLVAFENWGPFRKPKWERKNRYYACTSVAHGIAKGNTWPIPHCFKKERISWYGSSLSHCSKTWPLYAALCIAAIYAVCRYCKRESSSAVKHLPRLNAVKERKAADFQTMTITM